MIAEGFLICALALPVASERGNSPIPSESFVVIEQLLQIPSDDEAWRKVSKYMAATAKRMKVDYQDISDIVNDSCLALLGQLQKGVCPTFVKGYINGIVKHMAFNSFNKNKTEPLGETQYKDTKISIFDKTSRNETLEIIGKILSAMSDPRRTVVRMHLKEIQAEIIMEKLNITATQYRLHLSRGLDELEEKTKRKLKWSA